MNRLETPALICEYCGTPDIPIEELDMNGGVCQPCRDYLDGDISHDDWLGMIGQIIEDGASDL